MPSPSKKLEADEMMEPIDEILLSQRIQNAETYSNTGTISDYQLKTQQAAKYGIPKELIRN